MIHFLYRDFLSDRRVYHLNEAFYNRLFQKLTKKKPAPFFTVQFKNGEKFYDGNPIFSTLTDNRIVRIIQEEPESETPVISAWLDKATDKNLDELVISLELSKEARPVLEQLIKKWVVEKLDQQGMERFIHETIA